MPANEWVKGFISRIPLSGQALSLWGTRQWLAAIAATVAVGVLLGLATVLIPNGIFTREIPATLWNYPVWIATSGLSGLLLASYVKNSTEMNSSGSAQSQDPATRSAEKRQGKEEKATSRLGLTGGVLAWFAVGCPVCNKIALLVLGYSGATTYFAPLQPWLAGIAVASTFVALIFRLSGQVQCAVPARPRVSIGGLPR
ncbi:hypothetical protein CQ010_16040 [Arthrobacter sp. MYb211]|uniref:hypothetical protein n=1 Tax=Micrococcaceae TaxID=1268 RepID=UPI000CFE0B0C|nr:MULTISPECIES: hypothetical protein [unclassified Arthrobacter]PQZ98293.1 hypothetical protein CQ017_11815 [Arthrobacter sp. MYb224]PQZ98525.1 hypothetical protein CQ019_16960 [Arthrobacter sp. MYb229]PRA09941.1 hypothetical protein CQ015_16025 [Arthrobacter sp. MYb221]PRB47233.1 hypothetical protein CQ013_17260 [Arthrobacter sp. MYb216]PRC05022.1 hypothetical protein CQ010_16040 [Arthrobacter sp. MYb211]